MKNAPWLVAVDLQHAFADPASPWFTPTLDAAMKVVAGLVPLYGPRVVFTRFVPPGSLFGSWHDYYRKWPFAVTPATDRLWSVVDPWSAHKSVASHQFSKWVPDLQAIVGAHPTIVLCGVSTDCCVLATALGAVDGGAHVRVVVDACAAKTPEAHRGALEIMAARSPQLALVTAQQERALAASHPITEPV